MTTGTNVSKEDQHDGTHMIRAMAHIEADLSTPYHDRNLVTAVRSNLSMATLAALFRHVIENQHK